MKIGVIVGRFQSQRLTDGHKDLIKQSFNENDKLIIFIGVYPRTPDFKHPLPFVIRKQFIGEYITSLIPWGDVNKSYEIVPFVDVFNLPLWNNNLDKKVEELTSESDEVILYGGRDSFIFGYSGKYKTKEISTTGDCSATELRNQVLKTDLSNVDEKFREGIIFGVMYASGKIEA